MMCQYRFFNCNEYITLVGEAMHVVAGTWVYRKSLCLSLNSVVNLVLLFKKMKVHLKSTEFNRYKVSVLQDEKRSVDGCILFTIRMYLMPQNCTCKNG